MSLAPGQILTHYEILEPLGAGGMGEVWRARDSRLGRDVAIKVLPEELAGDEERLRRFEREARTLASLNHPNVAGIHGIDQVGDTCFLSMELVPGEDLAARLSRGKLPVDEALDVCRQIAEGLEAAHEAGVVHRDLKPANVRLTPEGRVKLLDFGLAKPMVPGAGEDVSGTARSDSFLVTEEGVVLGTPTYMSPEQARGKLVDRRTDVWAFGCVLYECLTGSKAFGGDTFGDVLATVLGDEPDWSALPPLPPRVAELLRRTLTKEPRTRLRDMGEARVQLELALEAGPSGPVVPASPASSPAGTRTVVVAAALVVVALAVGYLAGHDGSNASGSTDAAASAELHALIHEFEESVGDTTLSPDGRHVAWSDDGLWVRSLGELEPRRIHADEDLEASVWCWSPDSRELAFLSSGATWRLALDGSRPVRVAGADHEGFCALDWLDDGRLLFGDAETVWTVPADGGERETLLELDVPPVFSHWHFLHPLPDGRGVLGALHLMAGPLDTIEVFRDGGREAVFEVPGGNLSRILLMADGTLVYHEMQLSPDGIWSVPFSLTELRPTGEPRLVVPGAQDPSLSDDGTLAYLMGNEASVRQLAWLDRTDGELTLLDQPYEDLRNARLSPDGRQIAFLSGPPTGAEVRLLDLERGVSSPRIHRDGFSLAPVWLPDGRLVLSAPVAGGEALAYSLSGRGEPEVLSDRVVRAVSPDGQTFVLNVITPDMHGTTTSMVGPGIDGETLPWLRSEDDDRFRAFSPDGEWMLYTSERGGTRQLVLSRIPPEEDEDWTVSAEPTVMAWFRDDLGEILYVARGGEEDSSRIVGVKLTTEPEVRLGAPETVLDLDVGVSVEDYDGSDRFLVLPSGAPVPGRLYIDTGWRDD